MERRRFLALLPLAAIAGALSAKNGGQASPQPVKGLTVQQDGTKFQVLGVPVEEGEAEELTATLRAADYYYIPAPK